MTRKKKICIITITIVIVFVVLIFGTLFIFYHFLPLNSPRPYTVVNDMGKPLEIHEIWTEENLFTVKIDKVETVFSGDKFEEVRGRLPASFEGKLSGVLDITFTFCNVGYPGFQEDDGTFKEGLFFYASAIMRNAKGESVAPVPVASGVYHYPYELMSEKQICIGMEADSNHLLVPVESGAVEIIIIFRTYKDSLDDCYKKEYVYHVHIPPIAKAL